MGPTVAADVTPAPVPAAQAAEELNSLESKKPDAMDVVVEPSQETAAEAAQSPAPVAPVAAKKTKKRSKNRYKDIMASTMAASTRSAEEDMKAHQEKLKKTMGGGQFSKLERI